MILHTASFEWTNYEFIYTATGSERYMTLAAFVIIDEMEVVRSSNFYNRLEQCILLV